MPQDISLVRSPSDPYATEFERNADPMGKVLFMTASRTRLDSILEPLPRGIEKDSSHDLKKMPAPGTESIPSITLVEHLLTQLPSFPKPCRPSRSTPILIAMGRSGQLRKLVALLNELALPYEVTTSGFETLYKLCFGSYCVALIDPDPTEMDGYEIANIVRRYEEDNHLPPALLVAIERQVDDEKIEKCRAAGMDECLSLSHMFSKAAAFPS